MGDCPDLAEACLTAPGGDVLHLPTFFPWPRSPVLVPLGEGFPESLAGEGLVEPFGAFFPDL